MRPFGDRVPAWPPLAGVFALAGALVVAMVAPLPAAVLGAIAGMERTSPAIAGLAAGCALASLALGAVPARQRLGAARRPLLRGSAA
jgi:hypothetical protein